MFTGLIQSLGRVISTDARPFGRRLLIDPVGWDYRPEHGASIAVNGCCLTYAPAGEDAADLLGFDVIHQTLERTSLGLLQPESRVNLEACLTPTSRLGGHFVQGHVDATGRVAAIETTDGYRVTIACPEHVMPYIVPTGSIAIDGVSLTVAHVDVPNRAFTVALVPTTLELTTLSDLTPDQAVNLEVDLLVKSVVHYMQHFAPPQK